jgi:alanine racemase
MAFITLSRKAFFHNLDIISAKVSDKSKIALVLKDNAYGHGLLQMAGMAHEYGITKAVVRCNVEAKMIEHLFSYILVLDDISQEPSQNIHHSINSLEQIPKFAKGSKVELKVDTGMHRNGLNPDDIDKALELIEQNSLTCKAIFTHYRSADELSSELFWQQKHFEEIKKRYSNRGFNFHSANSAATFRITTHTEDMLRVGIAAYGCLEIDSIYKKPDLKPVLSLWAQRGATRYIKPSHRVGYNASGKIDTDGYVSTYDLGYADGLLRAASNRYTTPDGSKIVGKISMDNTIFTSKDDKLLVFNNANDFAKSADTIGYEVLTSLAAYLERKIIQE